MSYKIKVETISFCKRCGRCCNPIALISHSEKEIQEMFEGVKNKTRYSTKDLDFIIENWVHISQEEALELNPELLVFLEKKKDIPFFICKQFDTKSKLCMVHKSRPGVCSKFPFYDIGYTLLPANFILYTKECGYKDCMIKEGSCLDYVSSIWSKPLSQEKLLELEVGEDREIREMIFHCKEEVKEDEKILELDK